MRSRSLEKFTLPVHPSAVREHSTFDRTSSPFPVHPSISQKKTPDKDYWAIVSGYGRNRNQRILYKNLLFSLPEQAEFFYRQEMFAMPDNKTPEKVEIVCVAEYELEEPERYTFFGLPEVIRLMLSDYILHASMMIPASLHGDEEDPHSIYYSARFGLCGNGPFERATEEESDCENISQFDALVFGVRIRPAIYAPSRKKYLSFQDDGLPGLWVADMGSREEVSLMPSFRESLEGAYHACENMHTRMRRMQQPKQR